jgi:hypothetical protein
MRSVLVTCLVIYLVNYLILLALLGHLVFSVDLFRACLTSLVLTCSGADLISPLSTQTGQSDYTHLMAFQSNLVSLGTSQTAIPPPESMVYQGTIDGHLSLPYKCLH